MENKNSFWNKVLVRIDIAWSYTVTKDETLTGIIKELGGIGDEAAVPRLAKILLRKQSAAERNRLNIYMAGAYDKVEMAAAEALERIGGQQASYALEQWREGGGERRAALDARLEKIPSELADPDSNIRKRAAAALHSYSNYRQQEAIELFWVALKDDDNDVRGAAIYSMFMIQKQALNPEKALWALGSALNSSDVYVRTAIESTCERFGYTVRELSLK